jgi:hypothetical protein
VCVSVYRRVRELPPQLYRQVGAGCSRGSGTQFTCFTSTNVQILTQKALPGCLLGDARFCSLHSIYLLYQYTRTNTDTDGATRLRGHAFPAWRRAPGIYPIWCSIYLLYWYKGTNTDTEGAARMGVCEESTFRRAASCSASSTAAGRFFFFSSRSTRSLPSIL